VGRILVMVAVVSATIGAWGCGRGGAGAGRAGSGRGDGRLTVFVSITPQACFAERVGGDGVDVRVLVPPGQSPHTFELRPRQLAALSDARLYFTVGVPFERRLTGKLASGHPGLTVVDTTAGIDRRRMAGHSGESRPGRPDGHAEGEDPHVWLAPPAIKVQAQNMARAFQQADPEHADEYAANLAAFLDEVDRVHEELSEALAPYRGRTIYVFHPAFGYFTDAYGLRQQAIEVGGKSPTPRQIQALIERARADDVKVIFVQPQFDTAGAAAVAEALGGAVVPMDPLARDVLKNLEEMAAQVRNALAQ